MEEKNIRPYNEDALLDYSFQGHVLGAGPRAGGLPTPEFNKRVTNFEDGENVFD